jgi:hypothetical protein
MNNIKARTVKLFRLNEFTFDFQPKVKGNQFLAIYVFP